MNPDLAVREDEWGVTRVFALDITPETGRRLTDPDNKDLAPLETALGVSGLDPERAEVFAIETLGDMGLDGYLTEGYGVPEHSVTQHAETLGNVADYAAIVTSKAFGGRSVQLDPRPPARFVAAFFEKPQVPTMDAISSDSAEGNLASGENTPTQSSRRGNLFVFLVIAVIVLIAFAVFGGNE